MEEGLVHEGVTLKTLGEAAKAVEPGKEPLDHPTIAREFAMGAGPVLEFAAVGSASQGNAVADAAPGQREPESFAVIATVGSHSIRPTARTTSSSRHLDLGQGQRRSRNVGYVAGGQMTG